MFIFSARYFRFWFTCVLFVLTAAGALAVFLSRTAPDGVDAAAISAEDGSSLCRDFLTAHGWRVSEQAPEVTEVTVPETFNAVYAAYNELQKAQGFDLAPYRGMRLTKYLFRVEDYPGRPGDGSIRAAVLTSGGEIVGGDICSLRPDGFMHGFLFESVDYEFYPT